MNSLFEGEWGSLNCQIVNKASLVERLTDNKKEDKDETIQTYKIFQPSINP